jgi:hypothetical protein
MCIPQTHSFGPLLRLDVHCARGGIQNSIWKIPIRIWVLILDGSPVGPVCRLLLVCRVVFVPCRLAWVSSLRVPLGVYSSHPAAIGSIALCVGVSNLPVLRPSVDLPRELLCSPSRAYGNDHSERPIWRSLRTTHPRNHLNVPFDDFI